MQKSKDFIKQKIAVIALAVFGVIAVVSAVVLYTDYKNEQESAKAFEALRTGVVSLPPVTAVQSEAEPQTPKELYAPLVQQNPDMVAWLRIPNTSIDYPVMQTPQSPDYYLTHGFDKKYSPYGVPYAAATSDLSPSGENVIVYGHHTKNKGMFGALLAYQDRSYYEEHSQILFDTLEEFGTYQIVAVFQTTANVNDPEAFDYTGATSFADEKNFQAFMDTVSSKALYSTGVTAQYGDRLLLLSTCEYSQEDGRLVVVAKKLSESATK